MKSQNFEFLRARRATLADLAGFAERYVYDDPASSLIKQRSFVEHAVAAIYASYRLRPPYSDNLNDLMNESRFVSPCRRSSRTSSTPCARPATTPRTHGARSPASSRSSACAQLFDIARWFLVQVDGGEARRDPAYGRRRRPRLATNAPEAKTKDALEKLRLAEAKYESVLSSLQSETHKRLEAERAAAAHATEHSSS